MTAPAAPAPWPHRWVATMLAPEALVVAVPVAASALLSRDPLVPLCAAAALLAAAYVRRLAELARVSADQREPAVTPREAFRRDLPRCAASVLARLAGGTVLGLVTGLALAPAAALAAAAAFAVGWVQLVRQIAMILTFRDYAIGYWLLVRVGGDLLVHDQ